LSTAIGLVRDWKLDLVVGKNERCSRKAAPFPWPGHARRMLRLLKKDALKQVLEEHHFTGVIVGVRRDEEPTRAKERYFSPARQKHGNGTSKTSRPNCGTSSRPISRKAPTFASIRCLHWTEVKHLGIHRTRKHPGNTALFRE